jgi:hypothetical protein
MEVKTRRDVPDPSKDARSGAMRRQMPYLRWRSRRSPWTNGRLRAVRWGVPYGAEGTRLAWAASTRQVPSWTQVRV